MSCADLCTVAGAFSFVLGSVVLFTLGFFFGWRLAVKRFFSENEDLSTTID